MKNRIFYASPIFFIVATLIMLISGSGLVLAGQDNLAIDKVRLDFNAAFNEGNAEARNRMREIFKSGSVGGAPGNRCFYLEEGSGKAVPFLSVSV